MGKVTKIQKPNRESTIGEKIRYIRTKKGISQDELGGRISKSRVEINYYENNTRTPDIYILKKIAETLEVSMDYLCGLNDIEKPSIKYQAINEMIGLNEKSIYMLSKYANAEKIVKESGLEPYEYDGVEIERKKLDMVNKLLSSNDFEEILKNMIKCNNLLEHIKNKTALSNFEEYNEEHYLELKGLCELRIFKYMTNILCNKNEE